MFTTVWNAVLKTCQHHPLDVERCLSTSALMCDGRQTMFIEKKNTLKMTDSKHNVEWLFFMMSFFYKSRSAGRRNILYNFKLKFNNCITIVCGSVKENLRWGDKKLLCHFNDCFRLTGYFFRFYKTANRFFFVIDVYSELFLQLAACSQLKIFFCENSHKHSQCFGQATVSTMAKKTISPWRLWFDHYDHTCWVHW